MVVSVAHSINGYNKMYINLEYEDDVLRKCHSPKSLRDAQKTESHLRIVIYFNEGLWDIDFSINSSNFTFFSCSK